MKKIIFPLTLICFVFSLLFIPSKFLKVNATSVIQDIGIYYEVERVSERTRVNVTGQDIDIAIEAGRDVTLVSGPIFPPGGPIRPLSYGDTYASGFYYATPEDGKIIARHELKNDISSFSTVLRILQNEVDNFSTNLNFATQRKNNLLIEYLRSVNKSYKSTHLSDPRENKWGTIAGEDDYLDEFITYLNSVSSGGIEIREYLASFVSSSTYNPNLGAVREVYSNLCYFLYSSEFQDEPIDIIHFFASFDVACNYTGGTYLGVSANTYRLLSSWAGDLQTFCNESRNANVSNLDIEEDAFNNLNSSFYCSDLYADIDSFNLGYNLDLRQNLDFETIFLDYYNSLDDYMYRFTQFVYKLDNIYNEPAHNSLIYAFKELVYKMLCLNYTGPNSDPIDINPNFIEEKITYSLLIDASETLPSIDIRVEIAKQFSDYILVNGGFIW